MGQVLNQCCTPKTAGADELKLFDTERSQASIQESGRDPGSYQHRRPLGKEDKEFAASQSFGAAGSSGYDPGASTAVENQSSAMLKTQMKKVLNFKLFKSLRDITDLAE